MMKLVILHINFTNKLLVSKIIFIYIGILIFAVFNLLLIVFSPLMLNSSGFFSDIALFLYTLYSKTCHQIKERSFYFWGAYLPVCVRCFSIYSGFLFGCILFPFIRKFDFFSFPKIWLFFFAIFLVVIDVGFHLVGILDNSFLTRIISGSIAGFISAFFIIPAFVNAIIEMVVFYKSKKLNTNDRSAQKY